MMWLLDSDVRAAIERAEASGIVPNAEQQMQFAADHGPHSIMVVAGDTAEIAISGVLTPAPSFFAMLFGGGNTTYPDIISALAEAEADSGVSKIILAIDSPGGAVNGLFETIDAINNVTKPVEAKVSGMAASAAFAIATQADTIAAANRMSQFGSVGVVTRFFIDENEVTITSTNAPDKAPDVTTEEGAAVVRKTLDAMHDVFVDAIARGRNTTKDKVNAEFGRGAILLSDEALSRGMIDAIAEPTLRVITNPKPTEAAEGDGELEVAGMDLNELKTQHPAVYQAAVDCGTQAERDRVTGHLVMAEQSGDMTTAIKAIKEGEGMTQTLVATYLSAGMNRSSVQAREEDNDDATSALSDVDASAEAETEADKVAAIVEEKLGLEA